MNNSNKKPNNKKRNIIIAIIILLLIICIWFRGGDEGQTRTITEVETIIVYDE